MKPNLEAKDTINHRLKLSGLTPNDAKILKISPLTSAQAKTLSPQIISGFVIPYFDINGNKTPHFRARILKHSALDPKFPKYLQPAGSPCKAYFPPLLKWPPYLVKNVPILITEGELKAACATKHGYPSIGLGGVWAFKNKKEHKIVLNEIEQIPFKDRKVYIVYDSDAAIKPQVQRAENELAELLTSFGAIVYAVRLPNLKGNEKTGVDDFIVSEGIGRFRELLDQTEAYKLGAALHKMNAEVVYIQDPGVIIKHSNGQKLSHTAFIQHSYSNHFMIKSVPTKDDGTKLVKVNTAKEWLEWPHRAELERITYAPGKDRVVDNCYNTWTGWGVESKKGDVKLWLQFLDWIFTGDTKEVRHWFCQWLAYPIQHPGEKMATCVVLWGKQQGSGKTLLGKILMKIYGKNAAEIHDAELREDRNSWAENRQFVLADDITSSDSRQLKNRLHTLITQTHIRIDQKYVPSYYIMDCINYMFTSNDPDAFFMDNGDRRNFIKEVKVREKLDREFRIKLLNWVNGGGLPAIRYWLENYDTKGFDPQEPAYLTEDKTAMIELAKSDMGLWVHELHQDPLVIGGVQQKRDLWSAKELVMMYDPMGKTRVTANGMSRELLRSGFLRTQPVTTKLGQNRYFALRNAERWQRASHGEIANHVNEHLKY